MAHNDYSADMDWANRDFIQSVWPCMRHCIGGGDGELLSVENNEDELYTKLDTGSGIDYMHINGISMNGMAVRVQEVKPYNGRHKPYNTFTIRDARTATGADTEYKKRLEQILNNDIYPRYTLQAYVTIDTRMFLSGAIMRTIDLYQYAEYLDNEIEPKKGDMWWFRDNKGRYDDESTFRVIPWVTIHKLNADPYAEKKPIRIVSA